MAIEVLEDTARTVRWAPEKWWRTPAETGLTAPACSFINAAGTVVATLTVTCAAFYGTVGTVTSQTVHRLTLTVAGPPLVGTRIAYYRSGLWVASGKVSAIATVGSNPVTAYDVTYEEPLSTDAVVGDAVYDTQQTVSLTATHTATRAVNYRLVFSGSQTDVHNATLASAQLVPTDHIEYVHVVRHVFADPCTAADVRGYLGRIAPSHGKGDAYCAQVATEASQLVRSRILSAGMYPHLFGDPLAFRQAGQDAMRWWLAVNDGKFPPGTQDREAYARDAEAKYRSSVGEALQTLTTYDSDDDDAVDDEPKRCGFVRLVRSL